MSISAVVTKARDRRGPCVRRVGSVSQP